MEMLIFTTSSGKEIKFDEKYMDFLRNCDGSAMFPKKASRDYVIASSNRAGGADKIDYKEIKQELSETRKTLPLRGYAARFARAYQFIKILRRTDLPMRFDSHLDIGCGYGIQPRILKALGLTEHATGIDIYDRCSAIDEDNLIAQHKRLRWFRWLERLQNRVERIPEDKRNDFHRAILQKIWTPGRVFKYDDQPPSDFYSFKFVDKPHLDRYVCGNVFELSEKYDLITSFSTMEWFDVNTAFEKISDLLNVGGVFYFMVSNWWCDVNVTRLCGHFPYAMQRLDREDYFRYLDEYLPENAEAMKITYDFIDPNHPTLADYIEIAYANGLVPVSYRSSVEAEQFSHKRGIHPLGYARNQYRVFQEVLNDIHEIRSDVRLPDLLPFTHNAIFVKIDKDQSITDETLRQAYAKMDFHYKPKSRILTKLKTLAARVLPLR